MGAEPVFFRDLAYIFVAAVVGGGLAWVARQPLILGYVVGGLLISPFTPGPSVSEVHPFETFAEIGVILLMFSLGIEFTLRDLLRVRWVAMVGGPLGMALSITLGFVAAGLVGLPPVTALVVGLVVCITSSMVVVRLLMDRGELHATHARVRERFGVTVLAVARADGQVVRHPGAETILRSRDRVRVFGLPEQIAAFVVAMREER